MHKPSVRFLIAFILGLTLTAPLFSESSLPAETSAKIDAAVTSLLAKSGAPSASIAVVRDGKIAYEKAYGVANVETKAPATTSMRYSIGSISKQFTAAAILMLAEEGKLTLDDRLVRWFPDLTRANEVTIRQILSMTSGYQDFWPQDYVMPRMLKPVAAKEILAEWGGKPLDFDPGTKWQYSNTNYIIAGLIVENVSGMPLMDFLQKRVFGPLHMTTIANTDDGPLGPEDPARYMRYAMGPPRPAPKEGKGWMFAAGELAMTAHDLALWDISVIDRSLMSRESYRALEKEVRLEDGVGANYGLGVSIGTSGSHRIITHGGEVSGFTARNAIYPDDRVAIVVQVNLDATGVTSDIAKKVADLLFETTDPEALASTRAIFDGLRRGKIDRSLFTSNGNAYFSDQALADFASSLRKLGKVEEFTQLSQALRGGMTQRRYRVECKKGTVRITTYTMPDGKLEQYQVAAME